jgi:hypothetical protein
MVGNAKKGLARDLNLDLRMADFGLQTLKFKNNENGHIARDILTLSILIATPPFVDPYR